MLEVDTIRKEYGSLTAVDDVSLNVEPGNFVTIVGPSGCGKTTLLRMIGGHQTPTAGQIYLNDVDITDVPPQERPTSLVFQSWGLFPHMTVKENVQYPEKMRGDVKPARADNLLTTVQLDPDEYSNKKPNELSGGERQRVALARSLNYEPEILLLDEPLASLDRVLQKELQHELADLNVELETTFIYVTHSLETALKLSDQIVVVNAGEIVQTGTPEEIYYEPVNRFVGEFMGDCNIFPISDARNISDEATLNGPEFETPLTVDGYADAEEPQYVLLRQHDCAVNPTLSNDAGFQVQIYNTLMEGEHYLIEAESVTTDRQYTTEMSYEAYQRLDVDIGDVVYLQWDIDDMIFLPE